MRTPNLQNWPHFYLAVSHYVLYFYILNKKTMSTLNFKLEKRHPHLILFKYNFEQLEESDSQLTVEKVLLSFNSIIARFRLPLKCGRGGNHVWVSDIFDGRILIVESK